MSREHSEYLRDLYENSLSVDKEHFLGPKWLTSSPVNRLPALA
jgi:hypothetical protein